MSITPNFYHRQKLSPFTMGGLSDFLQVSIAQFIRDMCNPGVVGGELPQAVAGTWEMTLDPFGAYTRAGQRIFMESHGNVSLQFQGDVIPEGFGSAQDNLGISELEVKVIPGMTAGQEVWLTLGVLPYHIPLLPAVDGYGQATSISEKITWQFRIVHGTPALDGAAFRPDKATFFDNGLLLADVRVLAGQNGIVPSQVRYDRADVFSIKSSVLWPPSFLEAPAKFTLLRGKMPGEILVTEPNLYIDRVDFPPALVDTVIMSQMELFAPFNTYPVAGTTTIQVSKVSTFDAGDEVSLTLSASSPYVKTAQLLKMTPSAGHRLFLRCTAAGGHSDVCWTLTLTTL